MLNCVQITRIACRDYGAAALSYFNQAQLVRIQKIEWMEAYIKAGSEAGTSQNIQSAWRGAGLFPLNLTTVLHTVDNTTVRSS